MKVKIIKSEYSSIQLEVRMHSLKDGDTSLTLSNSSNMIGIINLTNKQRKQLIKILSRK